MNKNSNISIFTVLLPFLFLLCISCNSDSPKNDSDSVADNDTKNDIDSIKVDADDLSDDPSDEALAELEDTESEEADDVEFADVDYQGAEDCPALKAAKFPYYNNDGSIHFCRKCDKPTIDDPQCVKNLWSEANKKYFEKFPTLDCLNYPCVIENMKAVVKGETSYSLTDCDKFLTPRNGEVWSAGREDWRHHFFDKGKVIFDMYTSISSTSEGYTYPTDGRVFSYNPERDEYTVIMPNNGVNTLAYYNGKYISQTMNYNKISDKDSFSTAFKTQFLVMYEEGKGYRVIYPGTVRFIPYSSITISDDWIFMVFQEEDGKQYQMKYAKVGEWDKWYEMERETVNVPNLSGDNLAFYNNEGKAYICDLSKLPKKVSDCKLINREGEYIYNPVTNKTDPTRFAYTKLTVNQEIIMTVVKIEDSGFKYTDSTVPCQSKKEVTGYGVDQFKDDMIVHAEVFKVDQDKRSAQPCYYDVKTQKNTCQNWADQGIADFEGSKYLLYHTFKATGLILRNMECYCKLEPDACPFDEYMPDETGDDSIPDSDVPVYIY